ncbi:unnamed protein product [Mytilus coruscus]|uniref:Uncharacterized protein n=1 Tax=Mytilus coruscus TaxID=42192 RepID=A0A6J8CSA9_MYTCO|nr:unnamed protein product [Mytilus coruscus]
METDLTFNDGNEIGSRIDFSNFINSCGMSWVHEQTYTLVMMDEARCLERLVEQRSHRISYTRLLSWEIGPAYPTCRRRKRKNKKQDSLEFQKDSSGCFVQDKSHRPDTSLQSIETKSIESDISSESDNTYYSEDESQLQDNNFIKADELSDAFEDGSVEMILTLKKIVKKTSKNLMS